MFLQFLLAVLSELIGGAILLYLVHVFNERRFRIKDKEQDKILHDIDEKNKEQDRLLQLQHDLDASQDDRLLALEKKAE